MICIFLYLYSLNDNKDGTGTSEKEFCENQQDYNAHAHI